MLVRPCLVEAVCNIAGVRAIPAMAVSIRLKCLSAAGAGPGIGRRIAVMKRLGVFCPPRAAAGVAAESSAPASRGLGDGLAAGGAAGRVFLRVIACSPLFSIQPVPLAEVAHGIAFQAHSGGDGTVARAPGARLADRPLLHRGEPYASHGRPAFPKCP